MSNRQRKWERPPLPHGQRDLPGARTHTWAFRDQPFTHGLPLPALTSTWGGRRCLPPAGGGGSHPSGRNLVLGASRAGFGQKAPEPTGREPGTGTTSGPSPSLCPALQNHLPHDRPLLNTPDGPGNTERRSRGPSFSLARSAVLTLNRDPGWPLLYSPLGGAVTSG